MTTIKLPVPQAMQMSLTEALQKRRTIRECTSELTDGELATLLWATAGINSDDGRRTVPSTLDLKAVSVFVAREDGVWKYDAAGNTLTQQVPADLREATTLYQFDYVKKAPVTLIYVADHERAKTARPTGVYVDAGTMGQNAYLACAALNLAGCIRASFDHDALREKMNLQAHEEPILLFTVGQKA